MYIHILIDFQNFQTLAFFLVLKSFVFHCHEHSNYHHHRYRRYQTNKQKQTKRDDNFSFWSFWRKYEDFTLVFR